MLLNKSDIKWTEIHKHVLICENICGTSRQEFHFTHCFSYLATKAPKHMRIVYRISFNRIENRWNIRLWFVHPQLCVSASPYDQCDSLKGNSSVNLVVGIQIECKMQICIIRNKIQAGMNGNDGVKNIHNIDSVIQRRYHSNIRFFFMLWYLGRF